MQRFIRFLSYGLGFIKKYWYLLIISLIFCFSISFRFEAYFLNRQFWYDEAALASNFLEHSGFIWIFQHLNHFQMAPPLFLGTVFLLVSIFGKSDLVFRFLPFFCSILSIFVFYKLSKKFLKTKFSIIFANFLFAANIALILYGIEFKQYSSDILIFMSGLIWISKQNLENITFKDILKYNIVFTILFLASQPAIFLLFGFVLYGIIQNRKNFKIYFIPVFPMLCAILYKVSMPENLSENMREYWQFAFISGENVFNILKENLNFFFLHIKCLGFLTPLIFAGFIIFIFKNKTKIAHILILSLTGAALASILHFYPLVQRLSLFTFPFVIIFIASCFDFKFPSEKINKIFFSGFIIFIFLFLILFQAKVICKERMDIFSGFIRARDISIILKENFDNKKDILLIPGSNKLYYNYYAGTLKLNIDKNNIIVFEDKDDLNEILNKANKEKSYWIFITSNFSTGLIEPHIKEKLKKNKNIFIIYEIKFTAFKKYPSCLYKIWLNPKTT